jgi:hypothetical protein
MLFNAPLYRTTEWIDANLEENIKIKYHEYLYAVNYHLVNAKQASEASWDRLNDYQPMLMGKDAVHLWNFQPYRVLQCGDIAIRESSSVIDTLLPLMNSLFALSLDKTRMRWHPNKKEPEVESVREALKKVTGADEVISIMDSVFNSIGYCLLIGYRNWITHRGAPKLFIEKELGDEIPIPRDFFESTSKIAEDIRLKSFLLELITEKVHVYCHPFVPLVNKRTSIKIDSAPEPMEIDGIIIGKGAGIHIKNYTLSIGSLLENAKQYKKNNRHALEEGKMDFADESLRVYGIMDYYSAIDKVTRFVENLVTDKLDQEMLKLCQVTFKK